LVSIFNSLHTSNLPTNSPILSQQARIAALDPNRSTTTVPRSELPHCPTCKTNLLRPDIVWFGETLPEDTLEEVDSWIEKDKVDLMLVVGTTAVVYPAAGYVDLARKAGARVAVINIDGDLLGSAGGLRKDDWLFVGDAGEILEEILGSGEVKDGGNRRA
jgi:NAD-dependent deacetylase sirtuin 5